MSVAYIILIVLVTLIILLSFATGVELPFFFFLAVN